MSNEPWILRIDASERTVAFTLEAVLTPHHPDYTPPDPGEQYRYRTGTLLLSSDLPIAYELAGIRPNLDPDGSEDFGNIDTFQPLQADTWELTGQWGQLTITRPAVALTLTPASP
jgi:hypothetical protein